MVAISEVSGVYLSTMVTKVSGRACGIDVVCRNGPRSCGLTRSAVEAPSREVVLRQQGRNLQGTSQVGSGGSCRAAWAFPRSMPCQSPFCRGCRERTSFPTLQTKLPCCPSRTRCALRSMPMPASRTSNRCAVFDESCCDDVVVVGTSSAGFRVRRINAYRIPMLSGLLTADC